MFEKSKKGLVFNKGVSNKVKEDWFKVLRKVDEYYWGMWEVCETDEERCMLKEFYGNFIMELRRDYVFKGLEDSLLKKLK